ncbi:MAG: EamA family transporter [Bacteroidales bacterium]|nr:EamA family transporter [Bacteroidales bacterium]
MEPFSIRIFMANEKLKGHLASFTAYFIFGFNIILTKQLTNAAIFTPISLFTLRAFGAGLLFWLISLLKPAEKVAKKDFFPIFMASMLGYFGTQLTFLIGINYATPVDCAIISTFQPVLTMLIAAIALKEPITMQKAGGVALSLVGIIILILNSVASLADSSRLTTPFGLVMLLFNCSFFAAYLGIFKPVIQRYSVVTFMKWIFLFSFIVSAPFSISDIIKVDYSSVPAECWLELGYLIIMATFVAYTLIPIGQKLLRPTMVGLYSYLQPMIASVLGIYLGMDHVSVAKILAVVAVVAGVIIAGKSKSRADMEKEGAKK